MSMSTFLDVPHQAIPYFEPVKGNNGKNFNPLSSGGFHFMVKTLKILSYMM